ncbi:MAG: mannose-1-phosphate guanylyltransferase/mannose-6-phosphate isomerase [Pseudomonadales bacterium]
MTEPERSKSLTVQPVILCGGAGTRLWPLSREMYPKQLLSLVGDHSLLQDTVIRMHAAAPPLLVCNENHRFMVAEQLRAIDLASAGIMLEPEGRNTAPAVAVAAEHCLAKGEDAILVVLPSDHVITQIEKFRAALDAAVELAEQGYMVTFGVVPTQAETGYGYIKAGQKVGKGVSKGVSKGVDDNPGNGFVVQQFVEKPDQATAEGYIKAGDYYWNSGMFVFKASRYLEELARFRPDIRAAAAASATNMTVDQDFIRMDEEAFCSCPADSIDYAVMEKTHHAVVIPLDAGWSDIGSWDALWQVSERDENHNALRGDVIVEDVTGSYIRAEHRLVSAIGVSDLVIVETADAVMIASQKDSQHVKKLVANLKTCEREERLTHRKVFRPWGSYEGVDAGPRFQVKRICVNPGAKLSLQKHAHRAEHWVVVTGTAEVTRDDEVFLLNANESTFIPLGAVHRLANPTDLPLEIIEVQSGDYLGEDDIVRLDDQYGRTVEKE